MNLQNNFQQLIKIVFAYSKLLRGSSLSLYRQRMIVCCGLGLIVLAACSQNREKAEERSAETTGKDGSAPAPGMDNIVQLTGAQIKNAGIVTGKSSKKDISRVLKLTGAIDVPPQNMVSISAPLGGYLRSTQLLAGMHVSRGETIAVMEDQQYIQLQQDYLTAKAKLIPAEAEYHRQKELNQSKASSDKVFQQAEADYTTQKILLKSLAEKLRLISIDPDRLNENNLSRSIRTPAPIDGFVSSVNVNIGKFVNPSDVLFEIVNPNDIHLALTVFEKDIPALSIGQKLFAYSNNNPAQKYPCEIILIGKDFSKDRSVEVHCHFKKYDKILIPGMFMNAEVQVKLSQEDVLPSEAIVSFQDKHYIFVAKDERTFVMEEIRAGESEDGYTAVTGMGPGEGADEGANDLRTRPIVIRGAYNLLMKLKNGSSDEE
jgi:cobalt-zinc-cadmium efflux system membrane fusion protein